MIPPPTSPQQLLREAGLGPKKSWGQNFLCDVTSLRTIAAAVGAGPDTPTVELGAGLGALTYHLAAAGGRVVAFERDRDLAPVLRAYLSWAPGVDVREGNVLTLDYAALARELGGPLHIAGNLPYQLSGRILVMLADAHAAIERAVVLVQREVADRMMAAPGSRTYGLLSVLVQRAWSPRVLRVLPPGAFFPPPRVHSAVVRFDKAANAAALAFEPHLVAAARAAFGARRKTLKNALRAALHAAPPEAIATALSIAGCDPGARAETLSLADYARLGAALHACGCLPTHNVVDPATPTQA